MLDKLSVLPFGIVPSSIQKRVSLWLMFVQKQVKYDLSHTHSAGNCLVMAFLLAIVNGVGASALCAGIIWMCTRPLPGILLLLISVSSDFVSLHVDVCMCMCFFMYESTRICVCVCM
jgi:hypothetical protein